MKLYLATTNAGKVREFAAYGLAASGFSIEMLPGLGEVEVAPETGDSFESNAAAKALYYSPLLPSSEDLVLAEDSGLEVDALGGAPGIHSARWANLDQTGNHQANNHQANSDQANNARLLVELQPHANRHARYVSVIALGQGPALLAIFRGTVEGEILTAARGTGGFGYDPFFYYPPFARSFAELSLAEKASVSHRGAAIRQLADWLLSPHWQNSASR